MIFFNLHWFLQTVGIVSSPTCRVLLRVLRRHQDELGLHFALQGQLVVPVFGRERPPALGALLLEQVDGGDGAVGPEHVEGAEPRAPGAPGELGQVQRDRAQEVVLGERVRVPHLQKWCSDL